MVSLADDSEESLRNRGSSPIVSIPHPPHVAHARDGWLLPNEDQVLTVLNVSVKIRVESFHVGFIPVSLHWSRLGSCKTLRVSA
jgi:hypothetical protein